MQRAVFGRRFAFTFVAAFVLIATLALAPAPAHAIGLFPSPEDIVAWVLNEFVKPPLEALLNLVWGMLDMLTPAGVLTGSWANLLGDPATSGTTVYSMANNVNDALVKPIAYSVLALGMIVQLIQLAGKADQDAAMPLLRDIVMIVVYYVIFKFLISHSSELCEAVYNDLNAVTLGIGHESLNSMSLQMAELTDFGQAAVLLLYIFLTFLFTLAAVVVTLFMAYARGVQLYIFSAFSPIPLSLMVIEQTRTFGVGFIKNFVALCLAGAIMVFVLYCFPVLVNTALAVGNAGVILFDVTELATGPIMLIVLDLLLIFIMAKSGSIARSVLGE